MRSDGVSGETEAVSFCDSCGEMVILDQTLLPGEERFLRLREPEEVREAIYNLRVRGAPAIGIAAAYGYYLAALRCDGDIMEGSLAKSRELIASARPTAVNLFWALDRMEKCFYRNKGLPAGEIRDKLKAEADCIRKEDDLVCRAIGENGLSLLKPGMGILTHCNAGRLATARYGTALAPVYLGCERGYGFRVYADETRPLLQGARLTAYELGKAGVDVTLICDNMANVVMRQGKIDAVLVGCDRVAANGDAANKIGTSGVAALAARYGIPFYVCAPLSTIDCGCPSGDDIVIEERDPREVTEMWYEKPMAPKGVKVYNPAFDVTYAGDITAIITENGVVRPPYKFFRPADRQGH